MVEEVQVDETRVESDADACLYTSSLPLIILTVRHVYRLC
jgi:hypothetical protein